MNKLISGPSIRLHRGTVAQSVTTRALAPVSIGGMTARRLLYKRNSRSPSIPEMFDHWPRDPRTSLDGHHRSPAQRLATQHGREQSAIALAVSQQPAMKARPGLRQLHRPTSE